MGTASGASPDAMPLPKGGGSTRGLGDAFTPDLNRGTGGYSIAIEVPKGLRLLTPSLALAYTSANGDGPFGLGWSMWPPRIQLDTDHGVPDDDLGAGAGAGFGDDGAGAGAGAQNDGARYLLDGESLVDLGGGLYRQRVENAFYRVRRVGQGWEVTDKTGSVTSLGDTAATRVSGVVDGAVRDVAWCASIVRDTSGSELSYQYQRDGGTLYPSTIRYAAFEVAFEYEARPDPTVSRRTGFALTQALRCHRIEVRRPDLPDPLIRRYDLSYGPEGIPGPSLLRRVQMQGFFKQPDGTVLATTAPFVELEYTPFEPDRRRFSQVDFDAAGAPALDRPGCDLVDLTGDGLPDIVSLYGGRPLVWRNRGQGRFAAPAAMPALPSPVLMDGGTTLLDADGSGSADLVSLGGGVVRYYPNGSDGSFGAPRLLGASSRAGGALALAFDPNDRDTRVADLDGDGRVDIARTSERGLVTWRNGGVGKGFGEPVLTARGPGRDREALPDVRFSEPGVMVADMTGDGLPDVVHVANGLVEYWPSLGTGRYDRRQLMGRPPSLPRAYDPDRLFLADVDGSGPADLLYVDLNRVLVWRNLGGFAFADPVEVTGTPYGAGGSLRLVDLFGSGTTGVLWSKVNGALGSARGPGYRYLSLAQTKPYLLSRITDTVGTRTTIDYGTTVTHAQRDEAAGSPWSTKLPMPVPVVDRTTLTDLVTGNDDVREFAYHEGRWDPVARRFRGFGVVTVRRVGEGPGGQTGAMVEQYRYLVGAAGEPDLRPEMGPESEANGGQLSERIIERARRGQLYELVTFAGPEAGGPVHRREITRWKVRVEATSPAGEPVLFVQVTSTEAATLEGADDADSHPRTVTTEYAYDDVGNVISEIRTGRAPHGDDQGQPVASLTAITEVEYARNDTRYVMDRVSRVVRRDGSGALLGEVRHHYDGAAFTGLPLGEVDQGLLARQEEIVLAADRAAEIYGGDEPDWTTLGYRETTDVDGGAVLAVDAIRFRHTASGMVAGRLDPLGGQTSYGYSTDGLLVVSVTNALGHVRTARYDTGWQLLLEHTGADGAATRYRYDGLGRVTAVVRPGDSDDQPTLRYTHDHTSFPHSTKVERRRSGADSYVRITYRDGLNRDVQTRSVVDATSVRVSGSVQVDRQGSPLSKGLPVIRTGLAYEPPETLPTTARYEYGYDAVGRLVEATTLTGGVTTVAYTPWTCVRSDVIDTDPAHLHANTPRVERVDAFGRLSGVSLHAEGGAVHDARYTYDILGRLVASTDLEGRPALRSVDYDGRGARLRIDHASAGLRTAVFDAGQRLVGYSDGRGAVVRRTFDAIGRQLTEAVDAQVVERFHYDDAGGTGRLSHVIDAAGEVRFGYDERGRVVSKERTILGEEFTVGYEYDAADLQASVAFPDGSGVSFERWGDGRVRSVPGLVDELSYDALGRLSTVQHTNGVQEDFAYDPRGGLASIQIDRGAQQLYSSLLTRDAAGRLTRVEDLVRDTVEDSTLDALGRLVQFTLTEPGDGGQPAETLWTYDHDADGNLLRADEMGIAQYEYDFTKPGGLQRLVGTDGAIREVGFDVAGNLLANGDDTMQWDAKGRLSKVTTADGTVVEMVYDYRGARVAKRVTRNGQQSLVRYVDELYEDNAGVGNAYVFAAGRLVGRLRGGGRRHLHTDHRGSVVLVTTVAGAVDGRAWFHPFGASGGNGTPADGGGSRHFTGGVLDVETGLYYFNLRFYDPRLGRFLSPDPRFLAQPERELTAPEAHNLYAYAACDPLDYTDPTGQGFWESFGKVLAAIVVIVAVAIAVVVAIKLIMAAAALILIGAAIGALIGGIADGWEGAALGAMMGATIGINFAVGGPLGLITLAGAIPAIRHADWYHSVLGWTSWIMPASWPGHIMGLGIFLGNGIAHVFGSDKQIESMSFDWKHGQIMTAGGEYGGNPFPWLGFSGPAHNVGGFTFYSNDTWAEGGKTWQGIEDTVDSGRGYAHETGHMLSNALFGFWQGVINGIENLTTPGHDDRLFEKIAQSNVPEGDRGADDQVIPFWT